jgi:hypothetical protein
MKRVKILTGVERKQSGHDSPKIKPKTISKHIIAKFNSYIFSKIKPPVFETPTTKLNQLYCPMSFPKNIRLFESKYFKQTPHKEAKHNSVPLLTIVYLFPKYTTNRILTL